MFAKKKEPKRQPNERNRARNLSQFGLLDTGDFDFDPENMGSLDDDDDDDGLEAELLAITSGKNIPKSGRKTKGIKDMNAFNAVVADSLKDDPIDEEIDSDIENDPALLAELQQLTPEDEEMPEVENTDEPPPLPRRQAPPVPPHLSAPKNEADDDKEGGSVVQIIEERISAYKTAISASKSLGESSKVRRYERGLKTLESLLKSAKSGKPINEDEIPPMVVTGAKRAPSPQPLSNDTVVPEVSVPPEMPADQNSDSTEEQSKDPPMLVDSNAPAVEEQEAPKDDVQNVLATRRDQYKQAALAAKRTGDNATAVTLIKIAKQFDNVIAALEQGQPVDLTKMPPAPPGFGDCPSKGNIPSVPRNVPQRPLIEKNSSQGSAPVEQSSASEESVDESALFNAPCAPKTVLEALEQRLEKYLGTQREAQEQGNSSKARRMGRIVKQYQDAIKLHKAGKPVAYDDLPTPPGFGPIPHGDGPSPQVAPSKPSAPSAPAISPSPNLLPAPSETSIEEKTSQTTSNSGPSGTSPPPLPPRQKSITGRTTSVKRNQALHEKQLFQLQERQQMFREAALQAKKRGDMQAAKEYLRQSKGFAPMIEASKCGLPVDIKSAPVPPQLQREDSFEVVEYEDCVPSGDRDEAFEKLKDDLQKQISMCIRNSNHFAQLGDVNTAQKFHILADHAKKDLSSVKYAFKRGDPVPRFHYETRTFSIIQCFTDLTDNDLELTIVRGINYSCSNPREIDTYVKFEFPYPSDSPPRDRTSTVKDTNNPEYNKTFVLSINRKARSMTRVFKRGAIKFEIIAKGGFFRSDSLLGTVTVKLAPLETKCLIHDSFDLMDGRKVVGGKLEIKIRIREPLLTKQLEEINEKWLVIDQYK